MKKTLHGKRHIHARASVRVGRDNRRIKKFRRDLAMMKIGLCNLGREFENFGKALKLVIESIATAGGIAAHVLFGLKPDDR